MQGHRQVRRRTAVFATVVALLAVTGGGIAVSALADVGGKENTAHRAAGLPPATASVARGDLSSGTQVDGTLGYAKERKINAGTTGTLTWAPDTGSNIGRDGRLYEVDGAPVRLMYGTEPMYRTLKSGDKGNDVRQLEENLVALGYGSGLAVDDTYTDGTAAAVKRWQKVHDRKQTGRVGPDQISFQPSAVRVKSTGSAVGDQVAPGRPVLSTTGSERVVRVQLDVAEGDSAKKGTKVTVTLPDGTTVKGKVAAVGRTAKPGDDPGDKTPKIPVTVTFDDPGEVDGFDQSPVTVNLTGETRENVLSVPVNALLALPGGGFGVQIVEGGRTREVKVELGMFGQGRVEVSGGGLREGTKVGVPKP
ncbi:efflux RND transporter periplasmic adaptor subunit [Streptomyces sp. SID335]|nr:efflux RND transporter periplasmic adaptor subunit [Streptomyces sp. SID335]MYZ16788.1 efflux RND transporter periplasmic adaptor subunit [Streptomyces sp. SID337]NDZ90612.1 efflux RND transporter periplasmic adaptor subunit [Streptomyces sp. SID10115]NEA03143.1 efflux RND transporter periplasmic adaptor subunit [Streptomyces sp. SID10116]NEB49333.1 efflux RND transporter periplasmic adaptor subunit [Streptomyces sp. SID339]